MYCDTTYNSIYWHTAVKWEVIDCFIQLLLLTKENISLSLNIWNKLYEIYSNFTDVLFNNILQHTILLRVN